MAGLKSRAAGAMRAVVSAPGKAARSLGRMIFRRNPMRLFGMPRSKFDYLSEVGDGTGSSTVMAPLLWIARTFPEAPLAIYRTGPEGKEDRVIDHDLLRLMRRPNRFYSGKTLWQATLLDYNVDGNAYWIKIRDRAGRVVELWWAPHWTMEPKGDETTFVTHYEYSPGGATQKILIPADDVVHFRFGLDGDDPRKGRAPLKSVLREIFTDDEAANFTASLLRNMGIPGLLVSPDGDSPPSEDDVKETKAYIRQRFTGDNRGDALVMSGPTKVQQFGFSPEQLLLKDLRRIPEERVTAVLGVPAVVAGLGAGLDRSTFGNFSEAREAAYEQTIIPTQEVLAEELWFQLLPDFEAEEMWQMRVSFDLSKVRVLQPDLDKMAERLERGVRVGAAMRSDFRRAMGWDVDEARDDVFLIPLNVAEVDATGGRVRTFVPDRTPGDTRVGGDRRALAATVNGNGTGGDT